MRTCIGCRTRRPPAEMVRIAAGPHGVEVGPTVQGRGAYVCDATCLDRATRRGGLARALRTSVSDVQLTQLRESFGRTAARMTESSTGDIEVAESTPTKG